MPNILFAALPERWDQYEPPLRAALDAQGLDYVLAQDFPPETVDYIIYAPNAVVQDFSPFTRLKAVLSLWAGVEKIVSNPTLTAPLTRMVDAGLREGMAEWVTAHVLRHHLGIDAHINNPDHNWVLGAPPLARDRTVAILGLGELGQACAKALRALNFNVTGWSRSPKSVPGVTCFHGADGLSQILDTAEIAVLLLPDTPVTENTLDTAAFARMPKGAYLLNPGRGPLIDDEALLKALDTGQISHATLDVFRVEPLPKDHPFWTHPKITVTPHIASETRATTAAQVIAENIARSENGQPLKFLVNRSTGY